MGKLSYVRFSINYESSLPMVSSREYNAAVKDLSRNIFRYVMKCLQNEDESKDIVQDCYLKLWQNRANVNPEKVKFWLFSTAHNTMLNYIKKTSKTISIEVYTGITPYVNQNENFDLKELINKSLDLLPQQQKSIMILRDLEGYDYKEIGDILNLNESQVKVYLFRARKKMKNYLKELNGYYENN